VCAGELGYENLKRKNGYMVMSRGEYFFKVYNIKKVLFVYALMVFKIFCYFFVGKIEVKVLACSFETGNDFEITFSSPLPTP
jgi:hypothetical protein